MDIAELLNILQSDPKQFSILGKGAHCLALTHKDCPDGVLLLEMGREAAETVNKTNPQHARAVGFARQNDELLAASLSSYRNQHGDPFVHSSLMGAATREKIGHDVYLHIGEGKVFVGSSARLIQRIPGKALHYLDFVDPKTQLTGDRLEALAYDIAIWMYTLHHEVSIGTMVRNKVEKQFKDAGKSLLDRPLASEKFKIFVTQNVAEIKKLDAALAGHTLYPEYEHSLRSNMRDAGVNFRLLKQSAKLLEKRLQILLPKDRIGLSHSDIHPANVIASNDFGAVNGVCDWMSAGIDAQSVDFAGLGLGRGLLPKVIKHYTKREKDNNVAHPIRPETAYAYAAIRNIYITLKAVKNGYGNGCAARVAWEQVGECFDQLSRIESSYYGHLARRHKRQNLPPLRMPANRTQFKPHPSFAAQCK